MSEKLTLFKLHQRITRRYRLMCAACARGDLDDAIVATALMDHELDALCSRLNLTPGAMSPPAGEATQVDAQPPDTVDTPATQPAP